MIQLNKKTLIFLLVFSLLLGGAGVAALAKTGALGSVTLKSDDYDELVRYKQQYGKLDSIKNFLKDNYYEGIDEETLLQGAYDGLISGLDDPYSKYIPTEEYEQYLEELFGTETYYGVGITFISTPLEKGFYAMSVNTKGPAYAAGVRRGDYIVSVNGIDAFTMDGDTLSNTIRGELGTEVTIGLLRQGIEYYEVTVKRAKIETESVVYEKMDDDIAYIAISEFIAETGDDFAKALSKAEKDGAKGLIIDLRDNGGGLVSSAVAVADRLMEQGVIVSTLDHDNKTSSYKATPGRTDLPYVIIVNGNTASASEILCAGVQDNNEGTIIGTQTFGKGIIQNIKVLSDGSALKYTELQYLSPNGNKIHGVGITPDIEVDLPLDCYDDTGLLVNDLQLRRAVEFLKEGK